MADRDSHAIAMRMTPSLRKFALTAHVTSSVGWLGTIVGFFVLSIAGLTSKETETVRGVYIAMNLLGQYALVPLSLAALGTGIVQSLGTRWGLVRHYWVLSKLVLTIGATSLLLMHQFTLVAGAARQVSASAVGTLPDLGRWGTELIVKSGAAILLLLGITILAIYKPWGLTPYGRRKQLAEQTVGLTSAPPSRAAEVANAPLPAGLKIFLVLGAVLAAVFIALHLSGGGMHHRH